MSQRTRVSDEFRLRAAVERLVRDGRSQREIEVATVRLLGGTSTPPSLVTRLVRLVRA